MDIAKKGRPRMKDHAELERVKELVRKEIKAQGVADYTLHEQGPDGLWVKAAMNEDQRRRIVAALWDKGVMPVFMGPSAFGVAVIDS